ncbi:fumarylacetoacetate hydrolase family protein [Oceanobacillus kimchii]|uniref:fumarylacetoacetate hydrolase family protein n=1 Tax=Oceanobacillus kimchii TaxID=746691 RepID=UPI00098620A8|nr:fumarylacetoacetate hydrolase family protein [Oceanobacillus kimchii]
MFKTKTHTIVRYLADDRSHYGLCEGDHIIQLSSDFLEITKGELKEDGVMHQYNNVKILEPVRPSKIVNFGWTYAEHAIETGGKAHLKEPFLFLKPLSALIADKEEIVLPDNNMTSQVQLEGEVALIIGKRGKNISEEEAMNYIFGCTIFNDITARDLTRDDPQYTRGKGFDTFGPIGPHIVTGLDPSNLQITTKLNDNIVQDGNTSEMTLKIPYLISWLSQIMTLEPGDVLATGSPSGSCTMQSGDTVEIEVSGIGKLQNYVR